jgi:hypothetical protein
MKYKKKPVVVDAIKWDGSRKSTKEVLEFMGQKVDTRLQISCDKFDEYVDHVNQNGLTIHTLEDGSDGRAKHVASLGDYIIKGIQGEFYPCKPDIFEATYEKVE